MSVLARGTRPGRAKQEQDDRGIFEAARATQDLGSPGTLAVVRVLIADDDETYLVSLRGVIEAQGGLRVIGEARDGLEAIELTEQLGPDALVIDPHMPRLDGLAAIARLRRDYPSLCLIALTGDPAPSMHQAASAAGADGVFLKGEFLEKLLARLAAVKRG